MIFVGIWLFFSSDWVNGIWIGLIGLFILQAAQAQSTRVRSEAAMEGAAVQHFMTAIPPLAAPELTVQDVVDEYLLRTEKRTIPIVEKGNNRLVGIVTLADIRQITRGRWSSTSVGQIMTPRSRLKIVRPDQPMREALTTIAAAGVIQLPVISRDDTILGMLTWHAHLACSPGMLNLAAVLEHLQMERDLGVERKEVKDVPGQQPLRPPLNKAG
jgi:CBS domain-containing protein